MVESSPRRQQHKAAAYRRFQPTGNSCLFITRSSSRFGLEETTPHKACVQAASSRLRATSPPRPPSFVPLQVQARNNISAAASLHHTVVCLPLAVTTISREHRRWDSPTTAMAISATSREGSSRRHSSRLATPRTQSMRVSKSVTKPIPSTITTATAAVIMGLLSPRLSTEPSASSKSSDVTARHPSLSPHIALSEMAHVNVQGHTECQPEHGLNQLDASVSTMATEPPVCTSREESPQSIVDPVSKSSKAAPSGRVVKSTKGRPKGSRRWLSTFEAQEKALAKQGEARDWLLQLPPVDTENYYVKNIDNIEKAQFVLLDKRFDMVPSKPKKSKAIAGRRTSSSEPSASPEATKTVTGTRQSPRKK